MNKLFLSLIVVVCLTSCGKPAAKEQATPIDESMANELNVKSASELPVTELSPEVLVGKWLLLDSEGEVGASGDYLLLETDASAYKGVLVYQGSTKKCTLTTDGKDYFVISERGEKYEVSRLRSMHEKINNGIGLALITGFEDIGLGSFQREDVLKKFAE